MLSSIFGGIYTYDAETLVPIFVRLAVVIAVVAIFYDYFKRRWAQAIIEALNKAGADSPENAKTADELEKISRGVARYCQFMLKEGSMLRRVVLKAADVESDEEKKSTRLTGMERWYIPPAPEVEGEGIDAVKAVARRVPSSLREGAETSLFKTIVGIVIMIVAAELFIYFFPSIYSYIFENSKNIFG